jgi:hypothetical protein
MTEHGIVTARWFIGIAGCGRDHSAVSPMDSLSALLQYSEPT